MQRWGLALASPFPGHVSAIQVGGYFVNQYYQYLQQKPDSVHQFYNEASTVIRGEGAVTETATGLLQIHNLIMSLNFMAIEIKAANSLESWSGGVLVMVSGLVQTKDYHSRRRFVQTFFLAPQEKGYFVLNDIFHYVEDEQLHQHPTAMLNHSNFETNIETSPIPEPVSDYVLREENQTRDYVSPVRVEDNESVDKYNLPETQVSDSYERIVETTGDEPAPPFTGSMNNVPEQHHAFAEEPVGEAQKHTYASILRVAKGQPGHTISYPPSLNKNSPVASECHHVTQMNFNDSHPNLTSAPEKSSFETVEEFAGHEDEGDPRSVYLGNLPPSMTVSDLEHEFKNFGRLRPDGVSIRTRKETGVFYAFVEYEEASSVQNALKASPVQVNGRLIHVEGRRPNSGASRGRRGRGRGGYQSDVPRGRFSGRPYGRGASAQDMDYNNQSRGNGYVQRGLRSERGVPGNQFSEEWA